jgi:TP901 family phage tail tape measure protein
VANTLGEIRGQITLDVKQALNAYTQTRLAHLNTVTALHTGAGALQASGAAIAGVGGVMVGAFVGAIGKAAEFEKRLDAFGAVSQATAGDMEAVRQKALQLGKDTVFSANEIADSFIELGKQGRTSQDIIDGLGEATANLASAGALPLATAAEIMSNQLTTFGLKATDAVKTADRLAGAANASSVDVQDLGVSFKYVGGIAASLGLSFADTNTALAELGNYGIKGSTAGTSLRQVLVALSGPTKKSKEALMELGIATEDGGNKFYTAAGKLKPFPDIISTLGDSLDGLNAKEKYDILSQIFPIRAMPTILNLLKEGKDGFQAMSDTIEGSTAAEVAAKRLDNLSGDIEILKGNIETLQIGAGSGFQVFARFIVQGITDMISAFLSLPTGVQTGIVAAIAITGAFLIFIGTVGILAGAILNIIAIGIQLAPVFVGMAAAVRAAMVAIFGFNAAIAANPIVRVIAIISALVAIFLVLYNTNQKFHDAVQPLFIALINIFEQLAPIITNVMSVFSTFLTGLAVQGANAGQGFLGTISSLASTLGGAFLSVLQAVIPPVLELAQTFLGILMPVFTAIQPLISSVASLLSLLFAGADPSKIGAALDLIKTNITTLGSAIGTALPQIVQVLTGIVTAIIGMIPVLLTAGIQLFTTLIQSLAVILPQIITAILNLVVQIITALVGALPTIITAFVQIISTIVLTIAALLPSLVQAFVSIFLGLITAITQILPTIITAVVGIIPPLVEALTTALPLIITAAITLFTGIITALLQALPSIIQALVGALPQIINAVVQAIPLIITAAIALFIAIIQGLIIALPQIISAVVAAIPQIGAALLRAVPVILQAAVTVFMAIVQGLAQATPQVISALSGLIPQMVSAFGAAGSVLLGVGKDLIQGLINGIGSMASNALSAAKNVASGVAGAVKSFLHIGSPSRLFFDYGAWTTEGLANGISSMYKTAVGVARDLAAGIAGIPMELAPMNGLADSIGAAKTMAVTASSTAVSNQNDAIDNLARQIDGLKIDNNYNLEVNNPTPEPASDSLPKSLRAAAFLIGS